MFDTVLNLDIPNATIVTQTRFTEQKRQKSQYKNKYKYGVLNWYIEKHTTALKIVFQNLGKTWNVCWPSPTPPLKAFHCKVSVGKNKSGGRVVWAKELQKVLDRSLASNLWDNIL